MFFQDSGPLIIQSNTNLEKKKNTKLDSAMTLEMELSLFISWP